MSYVDRLSHIVTPLVHPLICNDVFWYNGVVEENMLCAGHENASLCAVREE